MFNKDSDNYFVKYLISKYFVFLWNIKEIINVLMKTKPIWKWFLISQYALMLTHVLSMNTHYITNLEGLIHVAYETITIVFRLFVLIITRKKLLSEKIFAEQNYLLSSSKKLAPGI